MYSLTELKIVAPMRVGWVRTGVANPFLSSQSLGPGKALYKLLVIYPNILAPPVAGCSVGKPPWDTLPSFVRCSHAGHCAEKESSPTSASAAGELLT